MAETQAATRANGAQAGGRSTLPVALDAMGGDYAPAEVVLGAVQAATEYGVGVTLVGPEPIIGHYIGIE